MKTCRALAPLLAVALLMATVGAANANVAPAGPVATPYGSAAKFEISNGLTPDASPANNPLVSLLNESLSQGASETPIGSGGLRPAALQTVSTFPAVVAFAPAERALIFNAPQTALDKFLAQNKIDKPANALADVGEGATGNPLADFSYLSISPSLFLVARSGKPTGEAQAWTHTIKSSLSYVRPQRTIEMVTRVSGDHTGQLTDLAAPLLATDSVQVDNLATQNMNSATGAAVSATYGLRGDGKQHNRSVPGRMFAFGFDFGLLPAVLGDSGLSVTVAVGESQNPGPYVSITTTLELPVEQQPESSINSGYQGAADITLGSQGGGGGLNFGGGDMAAGLAATNGSSAVPPESPTQIVPTPEVPEPATMLLLGLGAAALSLRRRMAA